MEFNEDVTTFAVFLKRHHFSVYMRTMIMLAVLRKQIEKRDFMRIAIMIAVLSKGTIFSIYEDCNGHSP